MLSGDARVTRSARAGRPRRRGRALRRSAARRRARSRSRCVAHGGDAVARVRRRPSVPHPLHGAADRDRGHRRRHRRRPRAGRRARLPAALVRSSRSSATSCGRSTRQRRWSSKRNGIGRTRRSRARVTACLGGRAPARRSWRAWDRRSATLRRPREASRDPFAIRDFLLTKKAQLTAARAWLPPRSRIRGAFAAWIRIEGEGRRRHDIACARRCAWRSRTSCAATHAHV